MSECLTPAEDRLAQVLATSARGPKRNGSYAVWLFVRACDGLLPPNGVRERSHRRRLEALAGRLSSLILPPPLRRALAGGMQELSALNPRAAAVALQQLVAPVREAIGPEAGDAVALAARSAREAIREWEA
jgi:hypothetical protein